MMLPQPCLDKILSFYYQCYSRYILFCKQEKGVTAIEYGLIAIVITLMIIVVFNNDGVLGALREKFTFLAGVISGAEIK